MVQLAYPLCKLAGIGDGSRQEHIINLVWEEDDGLFPDHTALYTNQARQREKEPKYTELRTNYQNRPQSA